VAAASSVAARLLGGDARSPEPFSVGQRHSGRSIVEICSTALDCGRRLEPLRVFECLVFGSGEVAEHDRPFLNGQRASQRTLVLDVLIVRGSVSLEVSVSGLRSAMDPHR
jgi:hypothetical protein